MSGDNKADGTSSLREMSRRDAIKASALGISVGVAGCAGNDSNGTTTGSTPSGTTTESNSNETPAESNSNAKPVESTYQLASLRAPPQELHYNFYNPQQRTSRGFVWDKLAETHYGLDGGELFYPMMAKSWEMDTENMTFTINLREDTTWWHNGEQVTSKDVWTMAMLEYYNREAFHVATESFEMPDDKTFVMHLAGETNPKILQQQALTRVMATPYSHFGDWADEIANNLSDEPGYQAIMEEIATKRIDEVIGNGPFRITGADRQKYTTEVHEGHWATDPWIEANAEGATLTFANPDRQKQLAFSDQIDHYNGVSQAVMNNIPDHFERVNVPATASFGLGLNHNREPLGDRRVRKALMYLLDREAVAGNMGPNNTVPEYITGISATQDVYIPEGDVRDQYLQYRVDRNKATQLLKDAGLSKQGGSWRLPDGSEWTIALKFMSGNSSFVQAGQTIVGQLSQFGINAELQTVDASQYWGELWTTNDFEAYAMYWGGWRPYPSNGLTASLYSHRHDNIGYPALRKNGGKIDVPMPIGEENGSMKTVNVEALITELSNSSDEKRNTEILRTLAWVYNQTLPELPMSRSNAVHWFDSENWNIPDKGSKHRKINIPANSWPKAKLLTPKTE